MDVDSVIFYTRDIERTKDFYTQILGFSLEYEQPGKYLSFIFPSGVRLGIKKTAETREIPGSQTIFISIKDIRKFYEGMKSRRITMYKELVDEAWGKNFSILDPDGNKVQFVERN